MLINFEKFFSFKTVLLYIDHILAFFKNLNQQRKWNKENKHICV